MNLQTATFAGGCFWCMETPFLALEGIKSITVGYMGGHVPNPTYEQVCEGTTGHAEVAQIIFDPSQVKFQQLLEVFWQNIDPTTVNQQFADVGDQYRTAIFYHTEEQKKTAEASKKALADSKTFADPIVTEVVPASKFYPAENYHQAYYKKNPLRYKMYRMGSGRDEFIRHMWGDKKGH